VAQNLMVGSQSFDPLPLFSGGVRWVCCLLIGCSWRVLVAVVSWGLLV